MSDYAYLDTFIGASMPFRAPRSNLVAIAIQYFTLSPNRVLNMTLKEDCRALQSCHVKVSVF